MHPLLDQLRSLELPPTDHALFGSGPLLVRGWIAEAGDLDVIARGAAWEAAKCLGRIEHLDRYGVDVVQVGPDITVGTSWGIGDFDIDELIDTSEMIGGIPCVRLEHVVAYKDLAGRPKDLRHLAIIGARLEGGAPMT